MTGAQCDGPSSLRRVKAKKGLQVVAARSADPAWAVHLERSRGPKHWSAVVTCRRSRDIQRSTRYGQGHGRDLQRGTWWGPLGHGDLCVALHPFQYGPS